MANKQDTGVGKTFGNNVTRVVNQDGSFNIRKRGGISGVEDIYHSSVSISWGRFLLMVLLTYLTVNAIFALIYLGIGVEKLSGGEGLTGIDAFFHSYYFSCQTFTTVGYGAISPSGTGTNVVAAIEALVGLMAFALITGLVYGRFSKPDSKILFSRNVLIAPYKEGEKAMMFRVVNSRKNLLLDVEAQVLVVVNKSVNDAIAEREMFRLTLEIASISYFPVPWTICHPLNEESPFVKYSVEELKKYNAEIMIQLKGFDETFSQTVYQRYSYTMPDLVENAKFVRMFDATEDGKVEVKIHDVHNYELV